MKALAFSELYPSQNIHKASPKAISKRTSYLRVRLEFLLYPQVIARSYNNGAFGPPPSFTTGSTCPWIAHSVSGLVHEIFFPLGGKNGLFILAFTLAPGVTPLTKPHTANLLARSTKSTPSSRNAGLRHLLSIQFQILFHPPNRGTFHLSLAVLVHYRS